MGYGEQVYIDIRFDEVSKGECGDIEDGGGGSQEESVETFD